MRTFYQSLADAADELGVSRERLRLWIRQGRLPIAGVMEGGGFVLSVGTVRTVGRRLVTESSRRHDLEQERVNV